MTTKSKSLKDLRKQIRDARIILYTQGGQWMASYPIGDMRNVEPLHYSIKTERQALELFADRLKRSDNSL